MSQHRRLNPTSRLPRRRPVPAYQVRHRPSASQPTDTHQTEHSNGHADTETPRGESSVVTSSPASGDTEAFQPVQAAELPADGTVAIDAAGDETADDDYAAYLQSVEEAAARSRSGLQASAAGATASMPDARVRLRGGSRRKAEHPAMAASGGGAPPRARRRTRNGRPEREPDPRPLFRRPRTWFVIVAMLFAVSALVVVLWSLNLAKATYDAYNTMHVEPTDRPVFEVNPEGTAVVVPTEQVAATLPDWENGDAFNIMLLGVDNRDGEDQPIRSDTMIVVRVDPTAKSVTMMSIPRDLWVNIPGFRYDKINAAYPLGEFSDVDGGGVATAAATIEANFDIRIHYFITVDFTGFRNIVDTIGGVIVDVPAPVKDDQYPTEDYGLTRAYFTTGLQRMDGETALRYTRTRHGDNDIARGERQQQVLMAIRSQALNLGLITRAESMIRDMGNSVRTDLNFNQLLALANLGRQIESHNIQRINLWEDGLIYEHWPEDEDDAFYFEGDWPGIWAISDEYFSTPEQNANPLTSGSNGSAEATPSGNIDTATSATSLAANLSIPILVQNASSTDLIATNATRILINAGYADVTPQNAETIEEISTIYDYVGDHETATHIARRLGLDESSIVVGSGGDAIVVVLGEDYASSSATP